MTMRRGELLKARIDREFPFQVGYPEAIRVDHGSGFISCGLDLWAYVKALCSTSPGRASRRHQLHRKLNGKSGRVPETPIGS